jgi:hypothetical protein
MRVAISLGPNSVADTYIEITREGGFWADRLRAYRIYLNGKRVSTIREGESQRIPVPPGLQTVQLRLDWARSRANG